MNRRNVVICLLLSIAGPLFAQTIFPTEKTTVSAGQVQPLTNAGLNPPLPTNIKIVRNVQYCTGGGHPLFLDLYLPKILNSESVPAVLWVHGGGWSEGDKGNSPLAAYLASKGMVAASANYRLSNEAKFPAGIEDVKCAIRYLRANASKYNINPAKIGIAGGSSGAHLAMLAGTAHEDAGWEGTGGWPNTSSRVEAIVSWFGPSDLAPFERQGSDRVKRAITKFLGGTPKEIPDTYRKASPITWVSAGDPPLLMIHGIQDSLVPISQSQRMEKAYRQHGLSAELIQVQNANHVFRHVDDQPIKPSFNEILDQSYQFFHKTLK